MNSGIFGLENGFFGKVVFLGLACEYGSTGAKGCGRAPDIIKELAGHSFASNETYMKNVSDAGVLRFNPEVQISNYLEGVELIVKKIASESKIPFSFGGDHLIAYPLIKGVLKHHSRLQVLHIDAHFDCNTIDANSAPAHNNFVNYLCCEPEIEKWIAVGQRSLSVVKKTLPNKFIKSDSENFIKYIDASLPIYITIDFDVLDPFQFPAVSFPEPGPGLTWGDLLSIISEIKNANLNIVGIDISEYNPHMDYKNYICGKYIVNFISKTLAILLGENL